MTQNDPTKERAGFLAMSEGTAEDWKRIAANATQLQAGLADRVLDHLRLLDGDFGGFLVDRLTHCLQTATRAERDGRDPDYDTLALEHFEPMVRAVFEKPREGFGFE